MRYLIVSCLLFIQFRLLGQEMIPIHNFPPEMYQGETQNWGICQSGDNNIYIANNNGLLEYNGAEWKLNPTPNHTIMRSVNIQEDKIYTGFYMEFGYWQKDEFNHLKYTSLSEKIKDKLQEDEQFWKIVFYHQWILFQSLHNTYIYDKEQDTFQIITSKTNLTRIFKVNDQIYFQNAGEGIFQLENGRQTLISDFAVFKENIVINIFPFHNKLLIETQDKGFFILGDKTVSDWHTEVSSVLKTLNVYSSLQLQDGSFILGTIAEGLFHLSPDGSILMHINKKNGLQNNTILSLFEDKDRNIWVGLDNGVSVLNFASFYKVYNDTEGNLGSVYTAALFQGMLYLGTNQGLFYRQTESMNDFEMVPGTKGQVWILKVMDGMLFCGHNSGTFIIDGNTANLICKLPGTWEIKKVENNENLLIQGNYEGLHILEKKNGEWKYRNKIEGFDISSRYFEWMPNNQLFVNHEYKGLYKLTVSDDFRKVISYKREESIPGSFKSGIAEYDGKLLYFGDRGFYVFNQQNNYFQKDTLLTKLVFYEDSYVSGKLIRDNNQKLWAFTKENVIYFSPGLVDKNLLINRVALPLSLRRDVIGYENIVNLDHDSYLLGGTHGYILFDLDQIREKECSVFIHSVRKSKQNEDRIDVPVNASDCRLKANENNIYFSCNLPAFFCFFQTKYQYELEGLEKAWSSWTEDPVISYKNLPPGHYTFKVRAKIGNKLSSNIASFDFSVAAPWYLSGWMIALYLLMFCSLFVALHSIYRTRYKRHKEKVDNEKRKEIAIIQLENEASLAKIRNEKLNLEIEARNQELVTSAMAIVKKNEILNILEQELNQKNPDVKSALRIIKENLTGKSDWEVFEEAFNKTDRDFLKKIKEAHTSLTPNDLKLCVYLRLNLSSKEIAPMLNISPQSVEIKRFRLRKKLELDHEQNLTEYILNL
jgi:AraC family transcriptional regulator, chitin signaling transcriptional activator